MSPADLLAYLKACQPRTPKQIEIQARFGIGKSTVYDALVKLERAGQIKRARYGRVIEVVG